MTDPYEASGPRRDGMNEVPLTLQPGQAVRLQAADATKVSYRGLSYFVYENMVLEAKGGNQLLTHYATMSSFKAAHEVASMKNREAV